MVVGSKEPLDTHNLDGMVSCPRKKPRRQAFMCFGDGRSIKLSRPTVPTFGNPAIGCQVPLASSHIYAHRLRLPVEQCSPMHNKIVSLYDLHMPTWSIKDS